MRGIPPSWSLKVSESAGRAPGSLLEELQDTACHLRITERFKEKRVEITVFQLIRETYILYNTMKTRRLKSSSPTITPAIPLAARCGKSYHLLLNCRKLSRNSCREVSAATAKHNRNIQQKQLEIDVR